MDRDPEKPPSRSPQRLQDAFRHASDKELSRQGDISLKAERIIGIAKSMHAHYERHAYARHSGTTYTPEDVEALVRPELTPPGITAPNRIPGTPKTKQDIARLARMEGQKRVNERISQLRQASKNMKDSGKHVSDGAITQTRRGSDTKTMKLKAGPHT